MNTPTLVQIVRALRIGLHVLWGALNVALCYPFIRGSRRLWLKQRWSRQLLGILSVRIDARLSGIAPGSLLVANHVSWLDIYALNAMRPLAFVAKAEVRKWPLIGWLAARTDTIFIRRGSRQDAVETIGIVAARLRAQQDVAIFPEGTTTDGHCVLPFHGALLQSAIEAQRPLQPVSIAYYDATGRRTTIPAYAGDTTMLESLAAIIACRNLTVRLRLSPAIDPSGRSRRELAQAARGAISYSLGVPVVEDLEAAGLTPEEGEGEPCSAPAGQASSQ